MNDYVETFNSIKPQISTDELADVVVEKTRVRERTKFRNTCVAVITITTMLSITLTVGAINGWDYTVVARFLFGGSQIAADGMHDEINFSIIENTYTDIEFELVGLYADDMSILLALEITADEAAFGEERVSKTGSAGGDLRFLFDHKLEKWVSCSWESAFSYSQSSENTVIYMITEIGNTISEGHEFSVVLPVMQHIAAASHGGEGDLSGHVEIKFIIDHLAMLNSVTVYPNMTLGNGNVITELRISPFFIIMYFDGESNPPIGNHGLLTLIDKDGNEMSVYHLSDDFYDIDGNMVKLTTANKAFTFDEYGNRIKYNGTLYDTNGNAVTLINDRESIDSYGFLQQHSVTLNLMMYNVLDAKNIKEIVYDGTRIPIE